MSDACYPSLPFVAKIAIWIESTGIILVAIVMCIYLALILVMALQIQVDERKKIAQLLSDLRRTPGGLTLTEMENRIANSRTRND